MTTDTSRLVQGTDGNDYLQGTEGNDTLLGGNGDDTLVGLGGDDSLVGGAGNDVFNRDTMDGSDTLVGGDGNDTFTVVASYMEDAGTVSINGGAGNDVIKATAGGGRVPVRATGGSGTDTYRFDHDSGGYAYRVTDFATGAAGDRLDLLGAILDGQMGDLSNPFAGWRPIFRLLQEGNDTVVQRKVYNTWDSYYTLVVLENINLQQLTAENFGGWPPDGSPVPGKLLTAENHDALSGGMFSDTIIGGTAADAISGNGGADLLRGGDETLPGAGDYIDGGAGADTLYGGAGNDTLYGGSGIDLLDGGAGDDVLLKDDSASETMRGGDGDDRFSFEINDAPYMYLVADGGAGRDVFSFHSAAFGTGIDVELTGGAGSDTYSPDSIQMKKWTIVTDFQAGEGGDLIDLTHLLPDLWRYDGGNPFIRDRVKLVQQGKDTLVVAAFLFGGEGGIVLKNVRVDKLTAANFVDGVDPHGSPVRGKVLVAAEGTLDPLRGGWFNDTLTANDSGLFLWGEGGDDVLHGGGGADTLIGGKGNDTLNGNGGDDFFEASTGRDVLDGGAGNDRFNVDPGYGTGDGTTATGGAGRDTYVLQPGNTDLDYTVTDFVTGVGGDAIDIAWRLSDYRGGNPFASGHVRLVQSGSDTLLQTRANDFTYSTALRIQDTRAADFTAANFTHGFAPDGSRIVGETRIADDSGSSLEGGWFDDSLTGKGGADTLYGGGGDDTLAGGAANDSLDGGEGADVLDGEAGDDTLSDTNDATMRGGEGNDRFWTTGNALIYGDEGNDFVEIVLFTGLVHADGGAGDDTFKYDFRGSYDWPAEAYLTGGSGSDLYDVRLGTAITGSLRITDFTAGADGDRFDLAGLKYYLDMLGTYGTGNPFAPELGYLSLVQSGADTLLQLDRDGLESQYGAQTAVIFSGVQAGSLTAFNFLGTDPGGAEQPGEAIDGGPDTDQLSGTSFADTIRGAGGDDRIEGLAGNDRLDGDGGDDWLYGGAGRDIVHGGAGNDVLDGGEGNDRLYGDAGDDTFVSDSGNDLIEGGDGDDRFGLDGRGSDSVSGGDGDDVFTLGYLSDASVVLRLDGGNGDDRFVLENYSLGRSMVIAGGGGGRDVYAFSIAYRQPVRITDFAAGAGGDFLDPGRAETNEAFNLDPLASGYLRLVAQGTDTLVQIDADGTAGSGSKPQTVLILENVRPDQLTGANWAGIKASMPGWQSSMYGSAGSDDLTGRSSDDRIESGLGDDTLDGDLGSDTLIGGAGNDLYLADVAGDTLIELANQGYDTVETTAARWVLAANIEAIRYTGSGPFHGIGNQLANALSGGSGNDTLDGAAGADTLTGGSGNDVYVADDASDRIIENADAGHDTVHVATAGGMHMLAANVEDAKVTSAGAAGITGNDLANFLSGNAAANSLNGAGGDDTLEGGAGSDLLAGGTGNDTFYVDAAGDRITELVNEGVDTVITALATYALATNVENLEYAGAAAFAATGNALDNAIAGGTGNDTIDGAGGTDTYVATGAFADYARQRPNATDVVLVKGSQKVTLRNIEQVKFTDGVKTMAEIFVNIASAASDTLAGTDGDDTLDGLAGADRMSGGRGNDLYVVDDAADLVVENTAEGQDLVQVALAKGTYALAANVEDAKVTSNGAVGVTGNDLANLLTGNAAANTLRGDAGNDTLDGGKGSDVLAGGSGDDTYYVDSTGDKVIELAGEGADTVVIALARYTLAANVEDLVYAGIASFAGTGNALDNLIAGGKANDTIDGAGGTDTYVAAGAFADYTRQRPNATDVVFTRGSQKITLKNIEQVKFTDGMKTMGEIFLNVASVASDTLAGTDGNDSLDGLAGADRMSGGKGNDLYMVDNAADLVIENAAEGHDIVQLALASGTYVLAANVEDAKVVSIGAVGITGNDLANFLNGNAAANTLAGGAGNDTLDGGKGSDVLAGGIGDDVYHVDIAGDKVNELANEGTDTVATVLAQYTLGANVENLVYTGTAAFAGTGNALDNAIAGGSGSNTIDGGAGTDTFVAAGAFADYARQRPNATDLVLVKGTHKIALKNIEQVRFTDGMKTLEQLYLNVASVANDTLTGTDGNDQMNGLAGADQLAGGKGDDVYAVDNAGDTVIESANEGIDTVIIGITAKTTYTLAGNVENATITSAAAIALTGNAADNVLTGNNAANVLAGGDGNDTLIGGRGNDTLAGGAGDDVYGVDTAADAIVETEDGGYDIVEATATKVTLAANVEELRFTGKAAFTGIGNALDNVIAGGAGNDRLTGGLGADTFVIGAGNDTVTDFVSGVDTLSIARFIGNGNGVIDGANMSGAPGGFSSSDELVIFAQTLASLSTANAAKAIGSAAQTYEQGDTALFALHDAKSTALYLFTSKDDNAAVSANELVQIATLTGVTAANGGDFLFG